MVKADSRHVIHQKFCVSVSRSKRTCCDIYAQDLALLLRAQVAIARGNGLKFVSCELCLCLKVPTVAV